MGVRCSLTHLGSARQLCQAVDGGGEADGIRAVSQLPENVQDGLPGVHGDQQVVHQEGVATCMHATDRLQRPCLLQQISQVPWLLCCTPAKPSSNATPSMFLIPFLPEGTRLMETIHSFISFEPTCQVSCRQTHSAPCQPPVLLADVGHVGSPTTAPKRVVQITVWNQATCVMHCRWVTIPPNPFPLAPFESPKYAES